MECPNIDLSAFTDSLDAKIAAEEAKATETQAKPKTYTVRGLADIARLKVEPMEYIWNEMPMVRSGLIEVIGAPGVGKSRFLSSLAKAQILGRPFGGLNTLESPKKWLFVGSENGIHRIQREAQKFILGSYRGDISLWTADDFYAAAERNGLSCEEVDRLNVNFQTFTLEDPEDCLIVLNEENCMKLTATLVDRKPDILVCDPWGDLINGDELSDADIRGTVRALRQCMAEAKISIPVIIVNHSRMGVREIANARGLDAGNFGKNSKCLYSIARYVLNIRPAAKGENPPIEVICAKNNDGRVPPPIAFKMNDQTETYEHLADFDHNAWQKELEGDVRGGRGGSSSHLTTDERDTLVRKVYKDLILEHGELPYTKTELLKAVRASYAALTVKNAELIVMALTGTAPGTKPLMSELGVEYWERGYPKAAYVGTPDQIARIKALSEAKKKSPVSQIPEEGN